MALGHPSDKIFTSRAEVMFAPLLPTDLEAVLQIEQTAYAHPWSRANFLDALQKMKFYRFGSELFASALWIALPMVGMLMFVNLALGIVSRVAPQMNIFAVGFPITLVVGLVGIAVTLPMLDQPFMALMGHVIDVFGRG